jgi:NADPH-dependent curcumin reductase CurA
LLGSGHGKERDLPALNEGEVRVANRWLSVDPYMRGRMNDTKRIGKRLDMRGGKHRLVAPARHVADQGADRDTVGAV